MLLAFLIELVSLYLFDSRAMLTCTARMADEYKKLVCPSWTGRVWLECNFHLTDFVRCEETVFGISSMSKGSEAVSLKHQPVSSMN